jgi:type IV secretory pathway TraG/TraD family ATPase VirD4
VAPYLAPAAGDRLRGSRNVDLRDALSGRDVVVFSLNSSRYGQLAAQLGTLIVQDLVSAVGERLSRSAAAGHKLPQAIVGIDEFSALGADHVIALLARGREAGVGTLLATQELADLDRAAFGLRDQVLGNTALKIAHRQDVPASAQTVAQMAGTEKTWEKSEHVAGGLLGGYPTRGGTLREVEQFVVHPNEIKTLPTGEAVVISKLTGARAQTARIAAPGRGLPARERKHRAADLG